ncbi:DODA-type extradiol aromatic ring-opening family dioxygenase [Neptuniibacter pectenicola]|uniref:DODA-type extradiol aromatic ring-opening family dioxygenase n=1 Tax=Neptuniibacter pectenicola TaxID=1806669 RepID=UPI00082E3D96|nr:class III extradiol ring-cleavage dioxygenase [Neptuniibacter pectenicola]
MSNYQVLFLSHGGGPMPLLGDKSHLEMVDCLKSIAGKINEPSAILVISAHWEENIPTITAGKKPPLIYDYYGFPEESYQIEYPCPGYPELAKNIYRKLNRAGIQANLDKNRGFDHGLFVPLKIMFPDADIPCVQLSLLNNLDPEQHIKIGESLHDLDCDNLLVIGSGFSFHNMKQFFAPEAIDSKLQNESFDSWLIETCSSSNIDEKDRRLRLINWEKAPAARFCHPREEHLLPLHICYGMTQDKCKQYFQLEILNKKSSMYLW